MTLTLAVQALVGIVLVLAAAVIDARTRWRRERKERDMLRRTLRKIGVAVVTTDVDGWITSMNTAAERLTGWSEAEALRHSCHEVLRIVMTDPRVLIRRDGAECPVEITVAVIRDERDRVCGRVHALREIDERPSEASLDAAAQTAASAATFDAFFEHAPIFAAMTDRAGMLVAANRMSTAGSGYERETLMTRPIWSAPWWGSGAGVKQLVDAVVMAAAGGAYRGELRYHHADGTPRQLDLSIRPIVDPQGQVIYLSALGVDVTAWRDLRGRAPRAGEPPLDGVQEGTALIRHGRPRAAQGRATGPTAR